VIAALAALSWLKRAGGFIVKFWREIFIAYLCIALYGAQGKIHDRDVALQGFIADQQAAALESEKRGAETGQEAVTTYVDQQAQDAPVIERVVTRVHNVCVRKPDRDLSLPAPAGVSGLPGREAQDQADREFAQAIADDLAACSGELNRLDAIRDFHNANTSR